nr:hypothetical protein [Paenibacillus darwinianus]
MLSHSFYNMLPDGKRKTPQIFFAGNNISSTYVTHLLQLVEGRNWSINVISKSGTTTEPAIAFRIFREKLEQQYGKEEARKRIYATTDREKGALKKLATEEGYESFIIPDDVGGRYSSAGSTCRSITINRNLPGLSRRRPKFNPTRTC